MFTQRSPFPPNSAKKAKYGLNSITKDLTLYWFEAQKTKASAQILIYLWVTPEPVPNLFVHPEWI
jgi:hypothetical protein